MTSDEQFTALGKSGGDITPIGFQTFSSSIRVGADISGIQAGVIGSCNAAGAGMTGNSGGGDGVFGTGINE